MSSNENNGLEKQNMASATTCPRQGHLIPLCSNVIPVSITFLFLSFLPPLVS